MVGFPSAAGNSQQSSHGKPDVPICHLSHRECADVRTNVRQGNVHLFSLLSSSSCGLSANGHCRSYKRAPGLSILGLTIGGWQTIGFNGPEAGVMWSAQSAVPVPWQRGHTGPKDLTIVHGWIGKCSVTKELKAGGTDDVWVVAGQYAGRPLD